MHRSGWARQCHGGMRPCTCAWCEVRKRCFAFLPCENKTEPACAGPVESDGLWTCEEWRGDELATDLNVVLIAATVIIVPCALLFSQNGIKSMIKLVARGAAACSMCCLLGFGPVILHAVLTLTGEGEWTDVTLELYALYILVLAGLLVLLFVLELWSVVVESRATGLFKALCVAVMLFAGWIFALAAIHATVNDVWTTVFVTSLFALWLLLLRPLHTLQFHYLLRDRVGIEFGKAIDYEPPRELVGWVIVFLFVVAGQLTLSSFDVAHRHIWFALVAVQVAAVILWDLWVTHVFDPFENTSCVPLVLCQVFSFVCALTPVFYPKLRWYARLGVAVVLHATLLVRMVTPVLTTEPNDAAENDEALSLLSTIDEEDSDFEGAKLA